jgi:hypothetical protein
MFFITFTINPCPKHTNHKTPNFQCNKNLEIQNKSLWTFISHVFIENKISPKKYTFYGLEIFSIILFSLMNILIFLKSNIPKSFPLQQNIQSQSSSKQPNQSWKTNNNVDKHTNTHHTKQQTRHLHFFRIHGCWLLQKQNKINKQHLFGEQCAPHLAND